MGGSSMRLTRRHREELDRIRSESGITGRLVGHTLYLTYAEFWKLRKWADELETQQDIEPEVTIKIVVEDE